MTSSPLGHARVLPKLHGPLLLHIECGSRSRSCTALCERDRCSRTTARTRRGLVLALRNVMSPTPTLATVTCFQASSFGVWCHDMSGGYLAVALLSAP